MVSPSHTGWSRSIGFGSRIWAVIAAAATAAVFLIEFRTPLGFAHGTLYVLPVLAAGLSGRIRVIAVFTALCVALTVIGTYLSPPGFVPFYVVLNRVLSTLTLLVVGGVSAVAVRHIGLVTTTRDEAVNLAREAGSSQTLFRLGGRLARLGGWSYDVPEKRLSWSDEVCDIHGVPRGQVPPLDQAIAFYAPQSREAIARAFRACIEDGTPYDLELDFITATGRKLHVRTIGEAVRDESGKIVRVHGAFQDITHTKQAEAERLRLATVLERMTDGIYILDHGWRFSFVNDEAERLKERTRADLMGKTFWEAFPETVEKLRPVFEQVMGEARSAQTEYLCPTTQHWFSINLYPTPEGLAIYFRVISERKQVEAALRESEERFRIVSQATADVVWDWNHVTDTIWWNEGMRTLFGYPPDTLPPGIESWVDRVHEDDKDRVLTSIEEATDSDATEWSDHYRFRKADGTYADVVDRGFLIRDDSGTVVRMIGSIVDVTEKVRLEAQLRQAQRLDAIGKLTGGIAHDFNNLLTVILGNAETLSHRLENQPKLYALADMTRTAAERGAALTGRLLSFARRQPLDPKPTDVNRQIAEMDPLLRRTLGEHIEIETVRGGGLWNALIDAAQLESAILNLCINARDAMPQGGRLTIETANVHLDGDYSALHPEVAEGHYVMVAVSDTGTGMTPDVMARAFEPFFSTKDVGKGSGLGLSMVYGFAKQSRGHVKIYSEPGEGTSVKLYLPRAIVEELPGAERLDKSALPRGHERILLVEDDDLVRLHVTHQLEGLGYNVHSVHNGVEAHALLKTRGDFDLLFTDVVMPGGLNGRQLADAVAKLHPALPVLFTSGYTENAIVHHGRLDPGVNLLNKPYRLHDLATKVRVALDSRTKD